jgi:hypothetical protein
LELMGNPEKEELSAIVFHHLTYRHKKRHPGLECLGKDNIFKPRNINYIAYRSTKMMLIISI